MSINQCLKLFWFSHSFNSFLNNSVRFSLRPSYSANTSFKLGFSSSSRSYSTLNNCWLSNWAVITFSIKLWSTVDSVIQPKYISAFINIKTWDLSSGYKQVSSRISSSKYSSSNGEPSLTARFFRIFATAFFYLCDFFEVSENPPEDLERDLLLSDAWLTLSYSESSSKLPVPIPRLEIGMFLFEF